MGNKEMGDGGLLIPRRCVITIKVKPILNSTPAEPLQPVATVLRVHGAGRSFVLVTNPGVVRQGKLHL